MNQVISVSVVVTILLSVIGSWNRAAAFTDVSNFKSGIVEGKNLSSAYILQTRLLKKIEFDYQTYFQKLFTRTIAEYDNITKTAIPRSKSKECFEYTRDKIERVVLDGINSTNQCLDTQMNILLSIFDSSIQNIEKQMIFPSCFKSGDSLTNRLSCIDGEALKIEGRNDMERNQLKKYQEIFDEISKNNLVTVISLKQCMGNFETVLNPSVIYEGNQFSICINQQAVAFLTKFKSLREKVEKREGFQDSYEVYSMMIDIVEDQHRRLVETLANNTLTAFANVTQNTQKNLFCCSTFPTFSITRTVKKLRSISNACFGEQRLFLNQNITSVIKDASIRNFIHQKCFPMNGTLSQSRVVNCVVQRIAETPDAKCIFEKADNNIRHYNQNFLTSKVAVCLEDSIKFFERLLKYSDERFELCVESQTNSYLCSEPAYDENYFMILRYLGEISDENYKKFVKDLPARLIPVPHIG